MKIALLALLAVLAFPSSTRVPFKTVAQGPGQSSQVTEREGRVIRTAGEWARYHARLTNRQVGAPRVDFRRYMLVAATQGQRPTGGHAIGVSRIRDGGSRWTVNLLETTPGPTCFVTQALTAPYVVVRVRRSRDRMTFRRRVTTADC